MRVKPDRGGSDGGCEPPTSSAIGAIARRSAILLGGTAAMALSIAQPVSAIVVNDQVAAAAGGIANYWDQNNQFPNVVSLFASGPETGSSCTGSLINSRTILTAAHCLDPNRFGSPTISFNPRAGAGIGITSFVRRTDWIDPINDIAVISLAQPVTNVAPVKLLTLQQGQPGFPTAGTTITMVGYGLQGTGSSQPAGVWVPLQPDALPPAGLQTRLDGMRRVATSSLGLYGVPFYFPEVDQSFFVSRFQTNPQNQFPNLPNIFDPRQSNLQSFPMTPLEGGTAGGDSGGPLFAVIGGQLVQIGVVRGGQETALFYCEGPGGLGAPPGCLPRPEPSGWDGSGWGDGFRVWQCLRSVQ
jgi:subtilase-type serine protease